MRRRAKCGGEAGQRRWGVAEEGFKEVQHELESTPARPSGARLEHGQDAGRVLEEEGCLDFVEPVNLPASLGGAERTRGSL